MKNPGCSEPGFFLFSLPPVAHPTRLRASQTRPRRLSFKPEAISSFLNGVGICSNFYVSKRGLTELADDAVKYIEQRYSRPADDVARMKFLKEQFSNRAADAITASEVLGKLDALTNEKKWSASSRNHHHNLLSLSYRLGILHRKVKESLLLGLRRQTDNNSRVRFLTADEEKRLRQAIRSKPEWAEHEPELDLAIHTGLRRSSMYLNLRWENVDLNARVASVPMTKNGDPIHIPLNSDAMHALMTLRARGDGAGRVIRNAAGEALSVNAHWFVDAVREAKITDFRWHDLRHTYASRLRQNGVSLGHIAELLGHKGLAMTRRYAHLSISNLHAAVAKIESPNSTSIAPGLQQQARADRYVN